MAVPLLLAVTGAPWEADVVRRAERAPGIRIVRRCVDIADVMAAAASGQARAVLLAEDLPRLTSDAVAALHARRIAVVAMVDPSDTGEPSGSEDRLSRMGIERILPADVSAEDLGRAITDAVESGPPATISHFAGGFVPYTDDAPPNEPPRPYGEGTGRVIAVWGPTGAPGRSTVAVGLATELAAKGVSTMLADADVYGGTVAQQLGMLDETSGLAAAARSAGGGSLDVAVLARQARQLAPCTVVDAGFCIESDEEISFDTLAPRRNGATLATLEEADEVVVVGTADPVGLTRLIRALHELRAAVPSANPRVVVNRLRSGPLGNAPAEAVGEALSRYAGVQASALLPFDQAACDAAMAHGRSLADAAKSSKLRKAMQGFAVGVVADLLS